MTNPYAISTDTIVALATPEGEGAIAIIRLSGSQSFTIVQKIFKGKDLNIVPSHTIHFGKIVSTLQEKEELIDEVLVSIFRAPHSYTGEDAIEISCHGSRFIVQKILQLCCAQGARLALPGEFTMRAFLHGKLDLSQAEAVADLIHSQSELTHKMAMHQLRGGFSSEINQFREQLINFAALIELELDFGEEDVEFADRTSLIILIETIRSKVQFLLQSFVLGNVMKKGVPVVIVGKPNAGKSTLFNALLNEDRALVSTIAGTTRDVIEELLIIDGIQFRFIDTAGIRDAKDAIEKMGIEKTYEKIQQSAVLLYVFDAKTDTKEDVEKAIEAFAQQSIHLIIVANHCDKLIDFELKKMPSNYVVISAKKGMGLQELKAKIANLFHSDKTLQQATIVSNARHADALKRVDHSLAEVQQGMDENKTSDLISIDIKMALSALGEITGAVEVDKDILGTIFGKFCIGK